MLELFLVYNVSRLEETGDFYATMKNDALPLFFINKTE
jgi:hypothetical protein